MHLLWHTKDQYLRQLRNNHLPMLEVVEYFRGLRLSEVLFEFVVAVYIYILIVVPLLSEYEVGSFFG